MRNSVKKTFSAKMPSQTLKKFETKKDEKPRANRDIQDLQS